MCLKLHHSLTLSTLSEKIEYTKVVIRSRKSKDRQHNRAYTYTVFILQCPKQLSNLVKRTEISIVPIDFMNVLSHFCAMLQINHTVAVYNRLQTFVLYKNCIACRIIICLWLLSVCTV